MFQSFFNVWVFGILVLHHFFLVNHLNEDKPIPLMTTQEQVELLEKVSECNEQ